MWSWWIVGVLYEGRELNVGIGLMSVSSVCIEVVYTMVLKTLTNQYTPQNRGEVGRRRYAAFWIGLKVFEYVLLGVSEYTFFP